MIGRLCSLVVVTKPPTENLPGWPKRSGGFVLQTVKTCELCLLMSFMFFVFIHFYIFANHIICKKHVKLWSRPPLLIGEALLEGGG